MVPPNRREADMFKLSDDDGRAVDMIWNSSASSNGNGGTRLARRLRRSGKGWKPWNHIKTCSKRCHTRAAKNLVAKTLQNIERRRSKRPAKFAPAQGEQSQHRRPRRNVHGHLPMSAC